MQWILTDIPIGKNIRAIRKKRKLTQKQVSIQMQLMGSILSRSTLANIESGKRNIKASDLKALKILLEVGRRIFQGLIIVSNSHIVPNLFAYTQYPKTPISHSLGGLGMQWILQDIPIGRNIQAIRIEKN